MMSFRITYEAQDLYLGFLYLGGIYFPTFVPELQDVNFVLTLG